MNGMDRDGVLMNVGERPSNGGKSLREPEKITFVALLGLTAILIVLILAVFYIVPYYGFSRLYVHLPWIMGILMFSLGVAVVMMFSLFIAAALLGRDIPFSHGLRSFAVKMLLPVLEVVGRLIGLQKEEVQHAFVAVNNDLVLAQCRNGHPPKKILLLMPHCLQDSECTVKVTYKVENCKRCGKCVIKDLLALSEKYGVSLAVATGGTFARRIVMETRPDMIIAVACERDLTSGIRDTIPMPVYGVFNERPFGPCFNTRVALDRVESVLQSVTAPRRDAK